MILDTKPRVCLFSKIRQQYFHKDGAAVDIRDYLECDKLDMGEDEEKDDYYEQGQMYIGLKCSENGKGINVGVFTDQYCTAEKDDSDENLSFPYQSASFVSDNCISCAYANMENDEYGYDNMGTTYEVSEMCENSYLEAVKCEQNLNIDYPDNEGCYVVDNMSLTGSFYERNFKTAFAAATFFFVSTLVLGIIALFICCVSKRDNALNNDDVHSSNRGKKATMQVPQTL